MTHDLLLAGGQQRLLTLRLPAPLAVVVHQVAQQGNADGQIVDGNPNEVQKVVDLWTFRRDTNSGDPNWQLIKTESEG